MIVLSIISAIHIIAFVALTRTWRSIPRFRPSLNSKELSVSVIIPVRNEETNIENIINDLLNQDYDDPFEIIVSDDHSEDSTKEILMRLSSKFPGRVIHLEMPKEKTGKKAASSHAVSKANGKYVLCTDGDCRLPQTWVSTIMAAFEKTDAEMVIGPVLIEGESSFEKYQAVEFSSMVAYSASTLALGIPGTCNGANMAYKKEVFEKVGGYQGNDLLPSGDDEFLLMKIAKAHPGKITFLKSEEAIVTTSPQPSFRDLLNQRARWGSKWRFHGHPVTKSAIVFVFLDYLSLIVLYGMVIIQFKIILATSLIVLRWISEGIYLRSITKFLKLKRVVHYFPIVSFLYPFYVMYLGFASIFGSYSWKGRSY